eukprot:2117773-Amphidinium_carterae.1
MIVNAGDHEGLTAWQHLVEQHEPQQRTRFAGQLQTILAWKFAGDIEGRMEAFEREFFVTRMLVEMLFQMLCVL